MRGGIEGHVRLLAEGQALRGHDVTVLVASRPSAADPPARGVRVLRSGHWLTLASTPLSPRFVVELRRLQADVTHLHFPYPFGEVAHLACGRGRHTVISYHSDIVRQRILGWLYRPLQRRLLARADALIASSAAYACSSPILQPHAAKCAVIPYGIDLERFGPSARERVAALRERYGTPLVLAVGRMRYYKGLEVLIDAIQGVSATLVVVGAGPKAREWRARAAASPACGRIYFAGELEDEELVQHYHAADVFVLPSTARSEAFGIVQLEAMAAGIPVISTELGTGTSTVNRHLETGLVVTPGDPRALSDALRKLLDSSRLRSELGACARARVEECYRAEQMLERVEAVYRGLLATQHGGGIDASRS